MRPARSLVEPAILRRALLQAVVKLDPRHMIKVPVMFVVEIGSVVTTVEFAANPSVFVGLIALWPGAPTRWPCSRSASFPSCCYS